MANRPLSALDMHFIRTTARDSILQKFCTLFDSLAVRGRDCPHLRGAKGSRACYRRCWVRKHEQHEQHEQHEESRVMDRNQPQKQHRVTESTKEHECRHATVESLTKCYLLSVPMEYLSWLQISRCTAKTFQVCTIIGFDFSAASIADLSPCTNRVPFST